MPMGVVENLVVQVGKFIIPAIFVILEIGYTKDVPLILSHPFLETT